MTIQIRNASHPISGRTEKMQDFSAGVVVRSLGDAVGLGAGSELPPADGKLTETSGDAVVNPR